MSERDCWREEQRSAYVYRVVVALKVGRPRQALNELARPERAVQATALSRARGDGAMLGQVQPV